MTDKTKEPPLTLEERKVLALETIANELKRARWERAVKESK